MREKVLQNRTDRNRLQRYDKVLIYTRKNEKKLFFFTFYKKQRSIFAIIAIKLSCSTTPPR